MHLIAVKQKKSRSDGIRHRHRHRWNLSMTLYPGCAGREGVQLFAVQHPVHLPQRPHQAHQAEPLPQEDPHRRGRDHHEEEDQGYAQGFPGPGNASALYPFSSLPEM